MNKFFFITGMLRSGTTLLQQILSTIPEAACHNQGLTQLFIEEKKTFLLEKGVLSTLPLSNYFPKETTSEDLTHFLIGQNFSQKYKRALGQQWQGDKEVLCEEFLPYLSESLKTVIMIRDPRDVIASIHFGEGNKYTGEHRPLLFDLRNWRKSFAFAQHLKGNPNFLLIKYEDLVRKFEVEYNRLLRFLEISNEQTVDLCLKKLSENWSGNSSFFNRINGLSTNSIGNSQTTLPPKILNIVEALCFPEMELLGYKVKKENKFNYQVIEEFKDPFSVVRPEFSGFNTEAEVGREIKRLQFLDQTKPLPALKELTENFIFTEVFQALKAGKDLYN